MNEVIWRNPPPTNRTRGDRLVDRFAHIKAAVQARPGEWAVLAENVPTGLTKRARHKVFPDRRFEITARTVQTKPPRHDVYVRWVGPAIGPEPKAAPAKPKPAAPKLGALPNGLVLRCQECDPGTADYGTTTVLLSHTLSEHGRQLRVSEKVPVDPKAGAS